MGNCSLKGVECCNVVKLVTDFDGIVELKGPILVKDVLNGFPPGLGIFRHGNATCQLGSNEFLIGGSGFYYLLPLDQQDQPPSDHGNQAELMDGGDDAAGRLSCRQQAAAVEVLPSQRNGVWKVKLVITPKELGEILSEKGNTEALIEKMRMAAAANSVVPARRSWKPAICNVFKVSPIDGFGGK